MYIELTKIKANVLDAEGKPAGQIELPEFFSLPVRVDLVRRAFLSSFTMSIQPKGRDPMAGKRTPAKSFGIGLGSARVPRIKSGEAALAPNTVGGRLTFPPTTAEKVAEKINKKEKILAVAIALSATAKQDVVVRRGHRIGDLSLPLVLKQDVESISKASEAEKLLNRIGLGQDIERVKEGIKIRSGKGKMRGRRYRTPKGPLFIVSSHKVPLIKALRSLPGVDVVSAQLVSVKHLAPGGVPGRLTVYTEGSIPILQNRVRGVAP